MVTELHPVNGKLTKQPFQMACEGQGSYLTVSGCGPDLMVTAPMVVGAAKRSWWAGVNQSSWGVGRAQFSWWWMYPDSGGDSVLVGSW
jgi:hypothetical protein